MVGHLFANGNIELHVILHEFGRHMDALGRRDQFISHTGSPGFFFFRQIIDNIKNLLSVDMREAGTEFFGDTLQCQIRTLAAKKSEANSSGGRKFSDS